MSLVYHFALVFSVLAIASYFGFNSPVAYILSFLYLYQVDQICAQRVQRRMRHEEKKYENKKQLLSDSETVRWMNHCMEKIWPVCMERVASQEILMPVIPWFLDKYKPWTAKKVTIQHLYLGRSPPVFTEIRSLSKSEDDDHMVLDMGMTFHSAEDMSAVIAVQLRKRLGFGMWAKLHVTGMQLEGKVRVGMKVLGEWPFLKRLRISFEEVPYFQMTVKPIFSHGLDVTELPGIAGWLDKLLAAAFEESLVEPNMLVVDVERLLGSPASSQLDSKSPGNWFHLDGRPPLAYAITEILEADDLKPSDPNGLADPFVRGCLGTYRFKTKIQKKTLNPKWQEVFKIPILSWELPNKLVLNVRDKDYFLDDDLGECTISLNDLRGGQRHDKWLPLENVKIGRLHLAITISEMDIACKMEDDGQISGDHPTLQQQDMNLKTDVSASESSSIHSQLNASAPVADEIESINLQGSTDSPIWIHHTAGASNMSKTWDSRKGKLSFRSAIKSKQGSGLKDSPVATKSHPSPDESEESSSGDEESDTGKGHRRRKLGKQLHRLRTIFKKDKGHEKSNEDSSGVDTLHSEKVVVGGDKESGVKLVIEDVPENLVGDITGCSHQSENLNGNEYGNFAGQKTDGESHKTS
ncbi:C2 domain-containing protein At1g53590 [Cryptomeria japonica]|uniref:C2 domain-containing protein At1g53590 n=1 Tax=Cryptomeria japonica TaxID=3369 RepID=UPI0027DA6319|nr:C2 domain-containing protein At1g53590 [Cryptomeria japonica]